MILRRALAVVACCLVVAARVHGAPLDDLERQIHDAVARRQASEQQRAELMLEAAALAETIGAEQASGARATAALERHLRDFDRLARRLDATDRAIKNDEATIVQLRRAFGAELDKLTQALAQGDARASAARATELDAARRRIDLMVAPPAAFRALLVVRPAATDTVVDLDQKLAVLAVERTRGLDALDAFDRELAVLGGRTVVTKRMLDDLEQTARAAPPDLRLIQRQVDEVQARLRDLGVKTAEVRAARATVVAALADLEQHVTECSARRAALIKG